jgi:hypothetical protein
MPSQMRSTAIFLQSRFFHHLAVCEKNFPHNTCPDHLVLVGHYLHSDQLVE